MEKQVKSIIVFLMLVTLFVVAHAWTVAPTNFRVRMTRQSSIKKYSTLSMEYIPDGLSKAQWEAMKKKEEEDVKKKNLGAIGITKFQSRSFEAWQKSGGKNLFPVDTNSPLEAKPYMQRPGGSIDGTDLKQKGLKGVAQGREVARNEVDSKYDKLAADGKLRSSPFSVPWTNDDVKKMGAKSKDGAVGKQTPDKTKTSLVEEPPKKKLFGLF